MKHLILVAALAFSSSFAFAGNQFPGECSDVCSGKALNEHSMMEIWQIVKNITQFEHPGLIHITSSTQASVNFLGANLGSKLEAEEARIRDSDDDKCYFMDNSVAREAARMQDAKKYYTAGTMYNALVKIVSARRCL